MPAKTKKTTATRSAVKVTTPIQEETFSNKLQNQFESNQSYLSLALGLLIVFAVGVLIFNYFKQQGQGELGTAQNEVQSQEEAAAQKDVDPSALPGKYTVKTGDTLFEIAQKYYQDGWKYSELVKVNKLANANSLEVGQVLDIPKLEDAKAVAQTTPTSAPSDVVQTATKGGVASTGTGGDENQTIWGEKITGDTYTVVEGDWLSKVAGRAYGDIMQYKKIAEANNIQNPDVIEPGMVLKLPR